MRRITAHLLAVGLLGSPAYGQSPDLQPDRQVIRADVLRSAGARRLSDIFSLIDDWDAATVDGFTYSVSARGLSPFGTPAWTLMVNGQTIDIDLFGVRNLDRLPLTPAELDSVVVIATPTLHDGVFARGGVIHLHASRPEPGFELRGLLATANETGDPGPFRFTKLATPNIDRIGTDGSGSVSVASGRAYVAASALWREHYVTDPLLRGRTSDILPGHLPIIKETGAAFRAGLEGDGGAHEMYVARLQTEDVFFLKQLGREIPAQSPFMHIGISGRQRTGREAGLRYRLAYSSNALEMRANRLDLDFDWQLDRWVADIETSLKGSDYGAAIGAGLEYASAETGYSLRENSLTVLRLFGRVETALGSTSTQTWAASLEAGEDDVGLNASLSQRWRPSSRQLVEANLAFYEQLPEHDTRIWHWQRRGYHLLADNGADVTLVGDPDKARTLALDLSWRSQALDALTLKLGLFARSHSQLSLEQQTYQFVPASQSFTGPVRLVADQGGEIVGFLAGANWQALPQLVLAGHYRFQAVVAGDELYESAWLAIPKHRLRLTGLSTPREGLSFWGALRYRSSSRWTDYDDVGIQTAGAYSSRIAEALAVDLAAEKWFWHRRMRLHLLLSNLLDDSVPFHPIGAAYGLSFQAQAEIRL